MFSIVRSEVQKCIDKSSHMSYALFPMLVPLLHRWGQGSWDTKRRAVTWSSGAICSWAGSAPASPPSQPGTHYVSLRSRCGYGIDSHCGWCTARRGGQNYRAAYFPRTAVVVPGSTPLQVISIQGVCMLLYYTPIQSNGKVRQLR